MSVDSTADFAQAVVSAGADGGSASGARARRGERDARRRSDARGAKAPADLKTDGRRGRANRRRRAETDDDDEGCVFETQRTIPWTMDRCTRTRARRRRRCR
jgi:hypothetical protein